MVAPLVDCGKGLEPCIGAAGKVCLIERGVSYYCQKVLNCTAGGGTAALIYQKAGAPKCQKLGEVATLINDEDCANATFPPTLALTRDQGLALVALLAAGTQVRFTGHGRLRPNPRQPESCKPLLMMCRLRVWDVFGHASNPAPPSLSRCPR